MENMEDTRGAQKPKLDKLSSHPSSLEHSSDEDTPHSNMDHRRNSRHSAPSSKHRHDDLELAKTMSIAETMSPMREFLFVGLLCSAQMVTQIGLVGVLNILHIIGPELGITDPAVLPWLVAGYSLTVGTFILLSGRCGDLFGYKNMLVVGYVWFAVWNVVAGCSVFVEGKGGQVLFIFCRVLGGIGPAILLPNALGLLGATYNEGRKKDMVFSLFGACAPGGAIVGGAFAGLWSLLWWPWSFWAFGIALVAMAILSVLILPSIPLDEEVRGLGLKERIRELDLLGAAVGITAMILFNFAWNQAPGFGWEQPYIYAMLIVGILLFPVFFWIEIKVAEKPLIPFDALSTDVSFVLTCIMCGWAAFGIWVYYFFQFFQRLRGESPLLTIAHTCPVAISGFIAAITTGHVISRLGPAWVMLISMLAFLTGNILVATMPIHQIYWAQSFVTTLIIPWGMDMSFPAATLIMSNAVAKRHQGMAASLVNTVVNYSISIGVGIAGTVEVHVNNGATTAEEELAGYRGAFYVGIGLSAMGVLTSLLFLLKSWMRRRGLPDELFLMVISFLPQSDGTENLGDGTMDLRNLCRVGTMDLRNLCLVSHKVRSIAQGALHSTVKIPDRITLQEQSLALKLLRTLFDRPDLALKIRDLSISASRQDITKPCEECGFELEPLRTQCLMRLGDLGYKRSHPWYRTIQNSIESGFVGVLLTLVPRLTRLGCWTTEYASNNSSGECVSGLFGSMMIPDCVVKEWVHLQHLTARDTTLLKCNAQLDSLTSLELTSITLGDVIYLTGPGCLQFTENLQHLSMGIQAIFGDHAWMQKRIILTLNFTALKHLAVPETFFLDNYLERDWKEMSIMPQNLPKTLETLKISCCTWFTQKWARYLLHKNEVVLPHLRKVTVSLDKFGEAISQLRRKRSDIWRTLCNAGISVHIYDHYCSYDINDLYQGSIDGTSDIDTDADIQSDSETWEEDHSDYRSDLDE
ncbi:Drug resistance [Pyrenophora seminiperda CCB06]|uniref:Drug resistance n=1 Tax=Pyrenophora seminiperda CCB06 TaxID=1302712 RepID=A0A3M7M9D8_9PLEO|nr:Drug resistance [Pyrenophora seminiperda CCB06]